jgi:leucyl-tRNA synthetase
METMTSRAYDPSVIEPKWQRWWDENHVNEVELDNPERPFYVLMMFPYPSAEGLHIGNVYAYTGADIQGRWRRMCGYDVLQPMGFDAFGIHSENHALKEGTHPFDLIPRNVANFTRQFKSMGFMLDWRMAGRVDTTSPDYYRWTQWIFVKLFRAGLAVRKEAPVT